MFRFRSRPAAADNDPDLPKPGFFKSLREGLKRTRDGLLGSLSGLLGGRKIDQELLDDIEASLLQADLGVEATAGIMHQLQERLRRHQLQDAAAVYGVLRREMIALLQPVCRPLEIPAGGPRPFVILMVGVNGTGKTTTIGKLAGRFQAEDRSVMLAAGDTFRAAAIEQLQAWGARHAVPVVAQHKGADPASVVFDALQSAQAQGVEVLIADTAGRLHTQTNLMEELKKVRRVLGKLDPAAPHETMLVLDASIGQNALAQARQFHAAVPLSGITLTKMDGTAKGGIIFALARELRIPVRFVGIGEQAEDLRVFDAEDFVEALLGLEG